MTCFLSRHIIFRVNSELKPFASLFSTQLRSQFRRRCCSNTPNPSKPSAPAPSSSLSSTPGNDTNLAKLSLFARFKQMYKDYYYVLIPVHIVTSIGWFGTFYHSSQSGVDLAKYMKKIGLSDNIVSKVTESGMGHVAVAYALYKIATPARYAVTLGGTTWAINRLQRMGYIKPAKEIISKGKERFLQTKGKN